MSNQLLTGGAGKSPPRVPKRPASNWRHAESMYTLLRQPIKRGDRFGTPHDAFGDSLRKDAKAVVQVVTDDAEISMGLLLRDDENNQIRVAHVTSVMGDEFEMRRRQEWRVDAVCKARIIALRKLS